MAFARAPSRVIQQLAPMGVLRAGINLSNFLLVVEQGDDAAPRGPSPRLAHALAEALGVPVEWKCYDSPSGVANAVGEWDVANIANEPQRATSIAFSPAYCEIEATCLVRASSPLQAATEIDSPGTAVAVKKGAAYALWLERNLRRAELVPIEGSHEEVAGAFFSDEGLDALAGLRPGLLGFADSEGAFRLLDGRFMAVQQSVGIPKGKPPEALEWLTEFVEHQKASGAVQEWIEEFDLEGKLTVAQP